MKTVSNPIHSSEGAINETLPYGTYMLYSMLLMATAIAYYILSKHITKTSKPDLSRAWN
jgi:hypothetical protein